MSSTISTNDNLIINESGQVTVSNTITNQYSLQSLAENYPVSIPYYKGLPDPVVKFTGRENEIKQIQEYLQKISVAVLNQTATISGLGGVGKTETAKAYAKFYRHEYKIILFIIAENRSSLLDTVYKFAKDFHVSVEYIVHVENGETRKKCRPVRDIVEELYNRCTSLGNTLIILDNVDEQTDIIDYLPSSSLNVKPKMLITSRRRDWELNDYGLIQTITLGVFDLKTATDFIKNSLNPKLYNDADIVKLCELLQYLPLALKQAMGFILVQNRQLKFTGNCYTISQYIQEYTTRSSELLEYKVDNSMYVYTVANTWRITKNKLKDKHGELGEYAVNILELLSYLSPDNISAIKIFHVNKNETNRKAISLLEEYSMIDCQIKEFNAYSNDMYDTHIIIHRLVQEITMIEVKSNQKEETVIESLLRILNQSFIFSGIYQQLCAIWNVACNYPNLVENYYYKINIDLLNILSSQKESTLKSIQILSKHEHKNGKYDNIVRSLENSVSSKDIAKFKYLFYFIKENGYRFDIYELLYYRLVNLHTDYAIFLMENGADVDYEYWNCESSLMIACKMEDERLIRYLCDKKCDLNKKSHLGETAFMFTCKTGNLKNLMILLDTGKVSLDIRDDEGRTGLFYACHTSNSQFLKYLVEILKMDVNVIDVDRVTVFMLACKHGNFEMVKILIDTGKVEPNLQDNDGMSALMYACKGGFLHIVKLLLETMKINLNLQDKNGCSAIMYAFQSKNLELVEYILYTYKIDLNIRNNQGLSIPMYACNYSNLTIVKYLIEVIGADVNVKSKNGKSILINACENRNLDMVKYFVETIKIELNTLNSNGMSVFMCACINSSFEIIEYLLNNNEIDHNLQDNRGMSAFLYACMHRSVEIVKYLVDSNKIKTDVRDHNGMSALLWACKCNDLKLVQYLIESCKMDLNERDRDGRSAFMHASTRNIDLTVNYLLNSKQFDVNDRDKDGRTPLHLICLSKRAMLSNNILDRLIRHGFDARAKDNFGKTAIDYCNEQRYKKLALFLEQNMKNNQM